MFHLSHTIQAKLWVRFQTICDVHWNRLDLHRSMHSHSYVCLSLCIMNGLYSVCMPPWISRKWGRSHKATLEKWNVYRFPVISLNPYHSVYHHCHNHLSHRLYLSTASPKPSDSVMISLCLVCVFILSPSSSIRIKSFNQDVVAPCTAVLIKPDTLRPLPTCPICYCPFWSVW